ncbi:MAG: magnesium chelatase subunit [Chloroflexota bacterium]|jgi:magnesium chelatase subunit D|nr:magnesium chelatase subunit [Chloroflexota bacterium]
MKLALVLNAINPRIGGVLIRGERGTAKSTAVRALAALLPERQVVVGCRFTCDPELPNELCSECLARLAHGEQLTTAITRMRVVELPVGASEDRVVGSIDIEAAIREGMRRFEPGLLAEANRNLLYVDEVNLLDDHLVDVLLDAAAMGVNTVEREGVSITHPSRFILVGTMNPEEGELRPQLLDRFGLCVDVDGSGVIEERVRIMQQDADHASDPEEFGRRAEADEAVAGADIAEARRRLPLVKVSRLMMKLASSLSVAAGVSGHRADIVLTRTARALAALRGLDTVGLTEIQDAAELALNHRRRETAPGRQPSDQDEMRKQAEEKLKELEAGDLKDEAEAASDSQTDSGSGSGDEEQEIDASAGVAPLEPSDPAPVDGTEQFTGDLFPVAKIEIPRERRQRRAAGKRTKSATDTRRGRYVRATQVEKTTDLALDATLRAAAPMQRSRREAAVAAGEEEGQHLRLERHDLRQKVRDRKIGNLIVFVVDASASMDAEQRMNATKGAVLSLLRDAYVRRDKVALVVFSGREAKVVLRPTSSVEMAEKRLSRLTVGGTTPLTHGLVEGLRMIRGEKLKNPDVYPLLVLISDGRGNISVAGDEPLLEAQRVAEQIKQEGVRALIIDSARDYSRSLPARRLAQVGGSAYSSYALNACNDLAEHMGGRYLGLYDLNQGSILAGVQESLSQRYAGGEGRGPRMSA